MHGVRDQPVCRREMVGSQLQDAHHNYQFRGAMIVFAIDGNGISDDHRRFITSILITNHPSQFGLANSCAPPPWDGTLTDSHLLHDLATPGPWILGCRYATSVSRRAHAARLLRPVRPLLAPPWLILVYVCSGRANFLLCCPYLANPRVGTNCTCCLHCYYLFQ